MNYKFSQQFCKTMLSYIFRREKLETENHTSERLPVLGTESSALLGDSES